MNSQVNGINLYDVKRRNRALVLNLIKCTPHISRKEIAKKLSLTPGAITLITTELIEEGILYEASSYSQSNKKGRKEVFLEISNHKFASIGIAVHSDQFHVICIDLNNEILFENYISTKDCNDDLQNLLDKLLKCLEDNLSKQNVLQTRKLLGIGISFYENSILVSNKGKEQNFSDYIESHMKVPVILSEPVCALAHGENYLSQSSNSENVLFIEYGTSLKAANRLNKQTPDILAYRSIPFSHIILEPNGHPCSCGNQGCLETMASLDAMKQNLVFLMGVDNAPTLCSLVKGDSSNITLNNLLKAYESGDALVEVIIDRAIYNLALAIHNSITLLGSKQVLLYGEFLESDKWKQQLYMQLSKFNITDKVALSSHNLKLDALGQASTVISHFFEKGGYVTDSLNAK